MDQRARPDDGPSASETRLSDDPYIHLNEGRYPDEAVEHARALIHAYTQANETPVMVEVELERLLSTGPADAGQVALVLAHAAYVLSVHAAGHLTSEHGDLSLDDAAKVCVDVAFDVLTGNVKEEEEGP